MKYHQVKVGGDAAALKGICKALVAMDHAAKVNDTAPVFDHAFIAGHTAGYEAFVASDLRGQQWPDIERASRAWNARRSNRWPAFVRRPNGRSWCYGMGVTQHRPGTENVQQTGQSGCCSRQHRTPRRRHLSRCAATPTCRATVPSASTKSPTPNFSTARAALRLPPARRAWSFRRRSITAIIRGPLAGLIASAATSRWRSPPSAPQAACRKLDLSVHVATKLNRTQLISVKGKTHPALPRPHSNWTCRRPARSR